MYDVIQKLKLKVPARVTIKYFVNCTTKSGLGKDNLPLKSLNVFFLGFLNNLPLIKILKPTIPIYLIGKACKKFKQVYKIFFSFF